MTWSARAPSLQATAGEPGGNSALAQRSGRRLGGSASSKRIERACRAADDLSRTFLGGGARSRPRPHLERARTRAHSGGRRRGLREPRGHSAKASGTGGGWAGAPARGAASAPAAQLQLSASPTVPSANPTWARPHPQPRQRRHTSRRGARFVSIMNTNTHRRPFFFFFFIRPYLPGPTLVPARARGAEVPRPPSTLPPPV